jgi:RNA polymerase subunit RPABC4/transcription elongation factor Spt4
VASRKCDHCGATVAADEQFCPNCGSFLDPLDPRPPKGRENVISVNSDGNYEEFELSSPPPESERSRSGAGMGEATCPSCGAVNPANNRHCQECGARLSQGPLPTAPRPAVQATAGVRAALAISALLFGVVVIALLFNVFNGDPEAAASSTSAPPAVSTTIAELAPIDVLDVECSREGLGSFVCANLINGGDEEYQFDYEAVPEGEAITIRLIFDRPTVVQRIDWVNLEDATRLKRNYRARGITIAADNSLQPVLVQLEDLAGSQPVAFAALDATSITLTIESDFPAEVVDEEVFTEMAIQEIRVIGRPGGVTNGTNGVTGTTVAGSTTIAPSTTVAPPTTVALTTTVAG